MKVQLVVIALVAVSTISVAYAEVPSWIKTNAGWWADGTLSDDDFLNGISYLVANGFITVPASTQTSDTADTVPSWIKTNAGWWADGTLSDDDFLNGISFLISVGLVTVDIDTSTNDNNTNDDTNVDQPSTQSKSSELASLQSKLEECNKIVRAVDRIDCQKPIKQEIKLYDYKQDSTKFIVGPVIYYWKGLGSDGNSFEISSSGQALLNIRMLAENTGSENIALNCTSPSICSYDVWDGSKSFKYSGMDFTSGQIVIKPGVSKEFNILFGPNIGYGGTQFEYDSSKDYQFRINESFGSINIDLPLE